MEGSERGRTRVSLTTLSRADTTFILLSFEGPDRYSMAGGLGMRTAELARALAEAGHRAHVVFVGDPWKSATETSVGGRLVLHRWCQWISKYYPTGVYQGEEPKRYDFDESVPRFVVDHLARPAIGAGRLPVIMGEEWHTAEAMCRISDALHQAGLRARALLLWNANNTTGFNRINWGRLGYVTVITTVSRYMKHLMWRHGVNPLVIPNGIPGRLLRPARPRDVAAVRESLRKQIVLIKVGRFHPDKRWVMAVETVASLKARGFEAVLLALGGIEPHEGEVLDRAASLGLRVRTVTGTSPSVAGYVRAFEEARHSDVLNVKSFVPLGLLRALYRASDAVLANSGHEPFGLVGLEAMASGGVAFTGGTGEDYAVHLQNGIVLETADPEEASWYVRFLKAHPAVAAALATGARRTARGYLWSRVVENLVAKVEFLAMRQGLLTPATTPPLEVGAEERRVGEPALAVR